MALNHFSAAHSPVDRIKAGLHANPQLQLLTAVNPSKTAMSCAKNVQSWLLLACNPVEAVVPAAHGSIP